MTTKKPVLPGSKLSPGEKAALHYVGRGYTATEAPLRLNKTMHTIKKQLGNAAIRLESRSAGHSIRLATESDQLAIEPLISFIKLTDNEFMFLELLSLGLTRAEIAQELGMEPREFRRQMSAMFRKLGVRTQPHAVMWGFRTGNLPLEEEGIARER